MNSQMYSWFQSYIESKPTYSATVCLLLVACGGCGGDGLQRYPVHGTVTYKDQPVEAGMIIFEPTESAGSVAPSAYLPINGGRYDALREGPTKGKYRVTVGGYDRANEKKDADGALYTPSLFPDYKFETDIPPENNELDITVPVTKKK